MLHAHSGHRLGALFLCLLPLAASAKDAAVPAAISGMALEMLKRSVAFKTAEGEKVVSVERISEPQGDDVASAAVETEAPSADAGAAEDA